MKSVSAALKAHLAQETTTLCTLWKITRQDGAVFGFTDADHDIVFGGTTYLAATGYSPTNIQTTAALNVDNLEVVSVLDSSTITEADMMRGLWDNAAVDIVMVNYVDLTMGALNLRHGMLGQIKTGRTQFTAELRGMTQGLQQPIGTNAFPACNADLGDARCTIVLGPLTVTGSVTGSVTGLVSAMAFIDATRTETNSTVSAAITGITQANPAHITAPGHPFTNGMDVTLSGVSGMTQLNGYTGAIGYIDANTFSVAVNSTAFTAYSDGGTATQAVASEYFQGGVLTWTSGANAGTQIEVKNYHPNVISLALPMVGAIALGDSYSLTPGCDKLLTTCNTRFANVVNFRGFPFVPGDTALLGGP
ncbi:MAG: DUF2163 domain-containing protein [Rhodocyclaceae bacterium]|nr:DUF2163 domain-containing protein [Rhodocyclaceae bacterium]